MGLLAVFARIHIVILCVVVDYIGLGSIAPALPFHLNATATRTLTADGLATWVGAINTAQYATVVAACLFWGRVSDRHGAKPALAITMAGDAIFFSLTAFAEHPVLLLVVRLGAGFFSPLVPALAYIFEQVPPQEFVTAMTVYSMAVLLGLSIGSAMVSLYVYIGWRGLTLPVGVLALIAFVLALLVLRRRPPSPGGHKTEGVWRAVQSADFVTTAATTLLIGYCFSQYLVLTAVMAFEVYQLSPAHTSAIFLGIPAVIFLNQSVGPRIMAKLGLQRTISVLLIVGALASVCLALPPVHATIGGYLLAFFWVILPLSIAHSCNQARLGLIGRHYTQNGTGQLSSYTRLLFAAGQALSPICATTMYAYAGVWLPWAVQALLIALTLAAHPLLGVALFREPEWRNEGGDVVKPVPAKPDMPVVGIDHGIDARAAAPAPAIEKSVDG